jgi:hypothetical protein
LWTLGTVVGTAAVLIVSYAMGIVVKDEAVSMVLYTAAVSIVLYELKAADSEEAREGLENAAARAVLSVTATVPEIVTMDVYELVASFELADDVACLLSLAAWCTIPSLLDSIFVPFSRAISSNAMQAKSAQRIVKRKGDLVANGV